MFFVYKNTNWVHGVCLLVLQHCSFGFDASLFKQMVKDKHSLVNLLGCRAHVQKHLWSLLKTLKVLLITHRDLLFACAEMQEKNNLGIKM